MMTVIILRPATIADSSDLLNWRNDAQTRAASISQAPVTRGEHERWFARSLDAQDRWIYLAIVDGSDESAGMCRFDLVDGGATAEVSINLNPDWRGKGIATSVLKEAIKRFRADRGDSLPLVASIRQSNVASARVFLRAGFVPSGSDDRFAHYRLDPGGEER